MRSKISWLLVLLCIAGWMLSAALAGALAESRRQETAVQIQPAVQEETAPAETLPPETLPEETIPEQTEPDLGNGVLAHGALRVEGSQLVDAAGEVTVLRGMSSHGVTWYPRYLNSAAMKTLRDLGANVQRLSMYTQANDGYMEDPETSLNYLYIGIESALESDMYVIVDWHILADGNPNKYLEEAKFFFNQISAHYGDNPALIYEICNEPNGDTDWEDVTAYATQVIPVIRENAPNALVLVGTPNHCTDFTGPMEAPLEFDNIMYTMHRYVDTLQYQPCDNYLIDKVVKAGLPIFVSEWGTGLDKGKYRNEREEMEAVRYQSNAQPFLDYMNEHDISWCAWALTNKVGTRSVLKSSCAKLSGWTDEDLTPFGKMIFSGFRQEKPETVKEDNG